MQDINSYQERVGHTYKINNSKSEFDINPLQLKPLHIFEKSDRHLKENTTHIHAV